MTLSPQSPLIVLADFGGSLNTPLSAREMVDVDIDTVDAAIHALEPEVALGLPFCTLVR